MTTELPQRDSLSVSVQTEGGLRIVALRGSAGTEQVEELEQRLAELSDSADTLILDLSELSFLNSAGLGAIIAAHRRSRERGGALCLAGPREGIAQLLRITHLDRLIPAYPSVEAARKARGVPHA